MPIPVEAGRLCEVTVPARPELLCMVRALVKCASEKAGCNNQLSEKLVIALNEACMNVIQHAYKSGNGEEKISLEILKHGGHLYFRLQDFAPPIDLDSNPSPVRLAKELKVWVKKHAKSNEYAMIASRAGGDVISEWTINNSTQGTLFDQGGQVAGCPLLMR